MPADPIGDLHGNLLDLRQVLVDGGYATGSPAGRVRDELGVILADWPRLITDLYGTPSPGDWQVPLPGPYGCVAAEFAGVRVLVQVHVVGPQGPVETVSG